jgi:hypothetical protein
MPYRMTSKFSDIVMTLNVNMRWFGMAAAMH